MNELPTRGLAIAGQTVKIRPVELDRMLLDVLGENQARIKDRKLSVGELEEVKVEGDPDRLKQLLLILVDNAIKYTPTGGEIRLGLRKGAETAVLGGSGRGSDAATAPSAWFTSSCRDASAGISRQPRRPPSSPPT